MQSNKVPFKHYTLKQATGSSVRENADEPTVKPQNEHQRCSISEIVKNGRAL